MLNPWEVEVVSDMPQFPFVPFLPSSKKLRWDQQPSFAMDGQLAMPTFSNNETPNVDSTAGMQGARHDDISFSKSSFHLEKIPLEPFMSHFRQSFNHDASTSTSVSNSPTLQKESNNKSSEQLDHAKPKELVLFGQTIKHAKPKELELFGETMDHAKSKVLVLFGQRIQIDSGNENAEMKITNYLSDPLQCKKDSNSEGETVEIEHSGNN